MYMYLGELVSLFSAPHELARDSELFDPHVLDHCLRHGLRCERGVHVQLRHCHELILHPYQNNTNIPRLPIYIAQKRQYSKKLEQLAGLDPAPLNPQIERASFQLSYSPNCVCCQVALPTRAMQFGPSALDHYYIIKLRQARLRAKLAFDVQTGRGKSQ